MVPGCRPSPAPAQGSELSSPSPTWLPHSPASLSGCPPRLCLTPQPSSPPSPTCRFQFRLSLSLSGSPLVSLRLCVFGAHLPAPLSLCLSISACLNLFLVCLGSSISQLSLCPVSLSRGSSLSPIVSLSLSSLCLCLSLSLISLWFSVSLYDLSLVLCLPPPLPAPPSPHPELSLGNRKFGGSERYWEAQLLPPRDNAWGGAGAGWGWGSPESPASPSLPRARRDRQRNYVPSSGLSVPFCGVGQMNHVPHGVGGRRKVNPAAWPEQGHRETGGEGRGGEADWG